MASAAEVVDMLVQAKHGDDDRRTQELFRQSLQALVELAKCEQRRDWSIEMPDAVSHRGLHTAH